RAIWNIEPPRTETAHASSAEPVAQRHYRGDRDRIRADRRPDRPGGGQHDHQCRQEPVDDVQYRRYEALTASPGAPPRGAQPRELRSPSLPPHFPCHTGEGRYPGASNTGAETWVPACAGTTVKETGVRLAVCPCLQ